MRVKNITLLFIWPSADHRIVPPSSRVLKREVLDPSFGDNVS